MEPSADLLFKGLCILVALLLYLFKGNRSYLFAPVQVISQRQKAAFFAVHFFASLLMVIQLIILFASREWVSMSEASDFLRISTVILLVVLCFFGGIKPVHWLISSSNANFKNWVKSIS